MKRRTGQAALLAYLGAVMLVIGFYPMAAELMERLRIVHAAWHLWLFFGAALLVYGLETLRSLARRHQRMTT
ncbi:MAG: hypothetical protein IRZ33_08105 [Alicyclobacillaceae bacterium]|nr:hypothetical protein [Alicyclobacillaceae bacterium]